MGGRARQISVDHDVLYPRDADHRLRIYSRRGEDLTVLAPCPIDALGRTLIELHADATANGRRLADEGAIGVYDAIDRYWLIMPWHRKEQG